jgi:transcriptional regulator with XRE-family HTH domain
MTTKRTDMQVFKPAKKRVEVSVGETLRILRELQELSQGQLAEMTGIPQPTISAIENDRINLGVDRAKIFATALQCHPAVLVFPGWESPSQKQTSNQRQIKNTFKEQIVRAQ